MSVTLRRLGVLVITTLLALGVIVQSALPAYGCSCMLPDPFTSLAEGDGAFVGTLLRRDLGSDPITDSLEEIDLVFTVDTVLKGEIGSEVVVKTANSGASCGIETPEGARVGLIISGSPGDWHGNLCWQFEPGLLLTAAEGLPAPVQNSPPILLVAGSFGPASFVALDAEGQVVGYGPGPTTHSLHACPGGTSFAALGNEGEVQIRSFADLSLVAQVPVSSEGRWPHSLLCIGENPARTLVLVTADIGQGQVWEVGLDTQSLLVEDVERLHMTWAGPVALLGDGSLLLLDPDGFEHTTLVEPVRDIRGQVMNAALSPDGTHLAVSLADWDVETESGEIPFSVLLYDIEGGAVAELEVSCDTFPIWLGSDRVLVWDNCEPGKSTVYDTQLSSLGEAPADFSYGWVEVADEEGRQFALNGSVVSVRDPVTLAMTEFAQLPGAAHTMIFVPAEARGIWTTPTVEEPEVVEPVEPDKPRERPPVVENGDEEPGSGGELPWPAYAVGIALVIGVIVAMVVTARPRDDSD